MTSIIPPAPYLAKTHGDLFRQLGATDVNAMSALKLTLSFNGNEAAFNARSLIKDSIYGAKLSIESPVPSVGMPVTTVAGIEDLLRGVANLDVSSAPAFDGHPAEIMARTEDPKLAAALRDILNTQPASDINLTIVEAPAKKIQLV